MIELTDAEITRSDMLLVRLIREIIRHEAGDRVALRTLAEVAATIIGDNRALRIFWQEQLERAGREAAGLTAQARKVGE